MQDVKYKTIHLLNNLRWRRSSPFSALCTEVFVSLVRCVHASVGLTVVGGVVRHVHVHVRVGKLLVAFVSVALRSGTLGRRGQAQLGQLGLLLLQALLAPLDASILEPDFDLEKGKNSTLENPPK